MKRLTFLWLLVWAAMAIQAQLMNPVHFKSELKTTAGSAEGEIVFTATIDEGWHVYSTELGGDGPIEATFHVVQMSGMEAVGKLTPQGKELKTFDSMFGMELKYFEQTATFIQKVRFVKPEYAVDCYLEYGACNDMSCLPPSQVPLKQKGKSPVKSVRPSNERAGQATTDTATVPGASVLNDKHSTLNPQPSTLNSQLGEAEAYSQLGEAEANSQLSTLNFQLEKDPQLSTALWLPVTDELRAGDNGTDISEMSLLYLLLMGFIGGLLAVCMPCIWPIIPMTVSFFLKRAKTDRKKGIRDAFTYGLSIIIIYLGLGLLVTVLFGSDTLNAMSTNAVFNIFLFGLLVVFALSFFGWFELQLPDRWVNGVDSKASATSGLLSIFLMAFTLVLVSFSCTAPIIGLLLVETTTNGNWTAPALGMFGFALALALPFTLFAMFPSWLKQMPKSGSWMNTLKIALGFIELAFALKFFSVADLAYGWHLLDREIFLSLWIVIFALLGAYLCGWLKFQTDEIGGELNKPMPVVCIMGGLASFAFAIYMVPGLWGAPCKAVSAFAPPMNTQDFNLNTETVEADYLDYEEGMAAAQKLRKPVILDFTGYGCVNCRKMEAAVWTDPRVANMMKNQFVLISLFVDDKTSLKEPFQVTDAEGNTKTLHTVGAKWSYLQSHKFGANAQPFYVVVDPVTAKPLGGSFAYDEDIDKYLDFLRKGLAKYKE